MLLRPSRIPGVFAVSLALLAAPVALRAQDVTALARGPRGVDPIEYRRLADSAAALLAARQWAAARDAWARVVAAYPHRADSWYQLGIARREAGDHLGAAQAYVRALEVGTAVDERFAAGHAAREYARAGHADSALAWLARAILDVRIESPLYWHRDTAFAALRGDPRHARLGPPSAQGLDRVAGWALDIDYLLAQHRRFNQAADPVPDSVARAADSLKSRVASLTDLQVALELQRLVVRLGRSHNGTYIEWLPERWGARAVPLHAYLFEGDVWIIGADSAHADLVGAKVLAVDGRTTHDVLAALAPLFPSEGETRRDLAPPFAVNPAVLHAIGVARHADRLTLRVVDRDGRMRTAEVRAGKGIGGYDYLPPSRFARDSVPLWMRDRRTPHWFEAMPAEEAVYLRVKNILNPRGGETMAELALRLRRYLEEHREVRTLVVDLRRNSGGNTYLYPELLRTIIAFDAREGRRTFALIDRRVYSAGMNFAIDLDRLTNATFVGEPTGASVEQHGDASTLWLPWSGVPFTVSTTVWNISAPHDDRRWIAPDVPVALTAADYFAHRDPVLAAALALARRR